MQAAMERPAHRTIRQWVDVAEAEELTGRSRWSWRKDAYAGKIGSSKVGRRLFIPMEEVQRVMAEGYRPALEAR